MARLLHNKRSIARVVIGKDLSDMPYTPGSQEGLPAAARKRLTDMRGGEGRRALFTSDLSVNEFLLVREAGFDPVGLVMGSSIYHIGFQFSGLFQNQEMDVLTQAMYHARELAMTRMEIGRASCRER